MEFEKTFDNAALDYDASRPAYPEELYADILRYKAVGSDSRILEIGMGTGKAAAPFLAAGCIFTGIEPGGNLAALASERFGKFDNFSCLNLTLQDYDCPEGSYDLIYAATAFHWIPEEYGYKRVFELLKSGGAFARFAYHAGPDRGRETLAEQIQALYAKHMPPKNRDRLPSKTGSEEKVPCREAPGIFGAGCRGSQCHSVKIRFCPDPLQPVPCNERLHGGGVYGVAADLSGPHGPGRALQEEAF